MSQFYLYHIESLLFLVICLAFVASSANDNRPSVNSILVDTGKDGVHKLAPVTEDEEYQESLSGVSKHPILIMISFDGFRYDYFSKAATPNLDWIKKHGVSAPYIKPQFPTKTFPNHQSLATGLYPESHGIVDNSFYDPIYNKSMNVSMEKFWVYNPNVIPVWILNEMNGGVSGTLGWPGGEYGYGSDQMKPTYIQTWNRSTSFEARVDTAVSWITNETNPANAVFLYFEEPDEHAHAFGPDSQEVKDYIKQMDTITGYIMDRLRNLRILDKVNLIFVSDHGFEAVTKNRIINITSIVNSSKYNVYGSSPSYHIQPKSAEDTELLYQEFKTASSSYNFTVYLKAEMSISKPYWHYSRNPRISPIILVADLGYSFDDLYGKMDYYNKQYPAPYITERIYGMHGYDNHLMRMAAFFRARGPAFRTGGIVVDPFPNIDLFPVLCELLKIPIPPNNGSLTKTHAVLLQHGFQSGAPIGWIIGGSVAAGLFVLFGIMSLLITRRRKRKSRDSSYWSDGGNESTIGYRYIREHDGMNEAAAVHRNGLMVGFNGRSNIPEETSLLTKYLSDESLSSTENQSL